MSVHRVQGRSPNRGKPDAVLSEHGRLDDEGLFRIIRVDLQSESAVSVLCQQHDCREAYMRSRVCLTPSGSVGLPTGRYTGLPRAGKPTDDAFIEAFNGRFRAECLNAHWFPSLCGRPGTDGERRKYYEERPHRSIGQKPPAMPLTHVGATSPPS